MKRFDPIRFGLLAGIILVTVVLYWPGLHGAFYLDDLHVLGTNKFIQIESLDIGSLVRAAQSFTVGGREVSMVSFALNYWFLGDAAIGFKSVNLFIHCLNGMGVFLLTQLIVNRLISQPRMSAGLDHSQAIVRFLPLIVTGWWLVQPINLIPVLYISQRMALLSAFFTLFGLVFYLWMRSRHELSNRNIATLIAGIAVFTFLGFRSKENGLLLPVYILILECVVLKFSDWSQRSNHQSGRSRRLMVVFAVGIVIALAGVGFTFLQRPDWIARGYDTRLFSMSERLLTEFRVLIFYIGQILAPLNNVLSLWHDDFGLSKSLFEPWTTLASLLALTGLAGVAVWTLRSVPLLSFGLLWFFVSHSLESSIIALELVHEHRNYLASFGILLAFIGLIYRLLIDKTRVIVLISVCLFGLYSLVLYQRSNIWSNHLLHAEYEAENRPDSARAAISLGQHYLNAAMQGHQGFDQAAYAVLQRAAANDPYTIAPELLLVVLSQQQNIDYNPQWLITAGRKLQARPWNSSSRVSLQGFYKCIRDKKCSPPVDDVAALFETVLQSGDSNMLTIAGIYYRDIAGDAEKSGKAFRAARRGEINSWLNYFSFLLDFQKNDIANDMACDIYSKFLDKLSTHRFKKAMLYKSQLKHLEQVLAGCSGDAGLHTGPDET